MNLSVILIYLQKIPLLNLLRKFNLSEVKFKANYLDSLHIRGSIDIDMPFH